MGGNIIMNNTYEAFYKSKRITVEAATSYAAQHVAAKELKVSNKRKHEITIVLVALAGEEVIHSTSSIG